MKNKVLPLLFATLLTLGACTSINQSSVEKSSSITDESSESSSDKSIDGPYFVHSETDINIYRDADKADKTMKVRFYREMPHVPYVTVTAFFKEFFNTDLEISVLNHNHTYMKNALATSYFGFDAEANTFFAYGLSDFNNHPDFKEVTGESFINFVNYQQTDPVLTTIDLNKYSIPIHEEGDEIYAPLTFLSQLAGGYALYNIAYNGKDIYVIDYSAELFDEPRTPDYYTNYYEILSNVYTERPADLANYVYNELCLVFDNFRGDTVQLVFGEDKLKTKGLNGILETEYPELKAYLLSRDKNEYYVGINALFAGLYDGGHTGELSRFYEYNHAINVNTNQSFNSLLKEANERSDERALIKTSVVLTKSQLGVSGYFYYKYDEPSKTAYIGFNGFDYDATGWDNYYKGIGEIPVETDTYAFIRDKFYQAKEDGAINVVLDVAANGGGDSYAYAGIVGLCNGSKSSLSLNDTFNKYRMDEYYGIDINLDGKYDQEDVEEANKFNFNIGVLTSSYSFSCANLFPSAMKDLGFKIIGQRSGGGSCAINIKTTGDGLMYVHSAYFSLTNQQGDNIDGGIEVDYPIEIGYNQDIQSWDSYLYYDYSLFYDFATVGNYLSNAYIS